MGIIKDMYESMCYEEKEKIEISNHEKPNSNICVLSGKACYYGVCSECSYPDKVKVKV